MRILFADDLLTLEYPPDWEVDLTHVDTPERAIKHLQHSRIAEESERSFDVVFLGSAEMVPVAEWLKENDYPAPIFVHTPIEDDRMDLLSIFKGFRHRITDSRGKFLRYLNRAQPIDLSLDLDRTIKIKRVI